MAWEKTRPILLVTGSSGLIGSRIVREFAPDFAVVGMDVKPPGAMEGASFVACDLTSDEDTARALGVVRRDHRNRIASVIHLAVPEIVRRLHEDPRGWYESNGLPVPDEFAEAPTGPNR